MPYLQGELQARNFIDTGNVIVYSLRHPQTTLSFAAGDPHMFAEIA
jgi:hypothetical protein